MARIEELLPEFRKGAKIRLSHWDEEIYIFQDKKGFIVDNQGKARLFYSDELLSDKWELYKDPIDWDAVIRNKCLCWFADADIEKPNFADRLRAVIENESGIKYMTAGKVVFTQCRPVLSDEVNFYENEYLRRKWRMTSKCK